MTAALATTMEDYFVSCCGEATQPLTTDEMRVELKRVRQESEWMHMVIDTCNDAFVSTDVMGEVLQWNSKAVQLFGWTYNEIVGRRLTDTIFPAEVSGRGTGGLQHLVQIQREGKRLETTARTKSGKQIPVEVSIAPMRKGSSFVLNAFIHDITARRQMQTQLNHANKLQSVGQLSAGIAHEINTPTQYVGDNTRFLQESLADLMEVLAAYELLTQSLEKGQDIRPALEQVHQAIDDADINYLKTEISLAIRQSLEGIERVSSIVRAMKEFSHPGSVDKTLTDINRGIQNTVTVATNEWKYVATVELDLDHGLPLVPCLPGDFNQVILNLVVNAAHAISEARGENCLEKGKITISTKKLPGYAEIRVRDTGTGIPEEIRDRIFDPFFTTKDVGVGSGQGLAIARSVIVDKHDGELNVETEVGKGTTFIIRLPLQHLG
jgi:two-component system, NtrC family, sensor kinase